MNTAVIEYLAGGLKHAIDIKYKFAGLTAVKTLQIVQVLYATPIDGDDGLYRLSLEGIEYVGFVDPGVKSPNFLAHHQPERVPGKPYYYSWDDLSHNLTYTKPRGLGMIRFVDGPDGLRMRQRAYFETAIVTLSDSGGPDVTLISLRWGWDDSGRRYSPQPGVYPGSYKPAEHGSVSDVFRAVLADNYPEYELI